MTSSLSSNNSFLSPPLVETTSTETTVAPLSPPLPPMVSATSPFLLPEDEAASSQPTRTPRKKHVVRVVTYVMGGLALVLLIASVVMLLLLRRKTIIVTAVTPSVSVSVTPSHGPPLPTVRLQPLSAEYTFSLGDITSVTSPVVTLSTSVSVSPAPSASPSPLPVPSPSGPSYEPGMIPFDSTIAFPLQSVPQGYGWLAMTPAADQWFSSMPNGYCVVAQYVNDNSGTFSVDTDAYKSGNNLISFCRVDPADPSNDTITGANTFASSVGAVSYRSIAMSADGTRLYVAYRQPIMGATDKSQIFPFLQLCGQVATFTRPADPSGGLPTSTDWTFACSLELSNPYGSQTAQFDQICDPITGNLLTGDDFGALMRVSTNLDNGNRMVAVRANFGLRIADGAFVTVYEETSDNVYTVSGLVHLFDGTTPFTLAEKLVFGRDFALGDDALLCAVRTPAGGCGVTTPRYDLVFFQRSPTSQQWLYQQLLSAPANDAGPEDFGVSLAMNADGTQALVGSPRLPTGSQPGVGGHVYVYQRATQAPYLWTQTQAFVDPFASAHVLGAFGYFVSVDQQFLVCAISANQNNVLTAPKTMVGTTPLTQRPTVVLVAIDQATAQLDATNAQQQPQEDAVSTHFLDPLWGASVAMEFKDVGRSTLRLLIASPTNQNAIYYTMSVG